MRYRFCSSLLFMALSPSLPAWAQGVSHQGAPNNSPSVTKVPTGVILVKGAWASASDSVTPVPEGGKVANGVFTDSYFGMSYVLPPDWTEKYTATVSRFARLKQVPFSRETFMYPANVPN
jgi:hypothetical protein